MNTVKSPHPFSILKSEYLLLAKEVHPTGGLLSFEFSIYRSNQPFEFRFQDLHCTNCDEDPDRSHQRGTAAGIF